MGIKQIFAPLMVGNIPEITPEEFKNHLGKVKLIDVRGKDEFNGELSHIPGAKLVTLGPELDEYLKTCDKNEEIVFVCRSGGRSGRATQQSRSMGFTRSINLRGGMLLWNDRKFPLEKEK